MKNVLFLMELDTRVVINAPPRAHIHETLFGVALVNIRPHSGGCSWN